MSDILTRVRNVRSIIKPTIQATDLSSFLRNNKSKLLLISYSPHFTRGANGHRGYVFLDNVANQDPIFSRLSTASSKLSHLINLRESQLNNKAVSKEKFFDLLYSDERLNKLKNLQLETDCLLHKYRLLDKFWEKAPNVSVKDDELYDFVNENPLYTIETWVSPRQPNFTFRHDLEDIVSDFAPVLTSEMLKLIDWYNLDTRHRIANSSENIEPNINDPFKDLTVRLVDVDPENTGGFVNSYGITVLNNEFGRNSSTFAHELHHYIRPLLNRKGGVGKQDPLDRQLIARLKENNTGYTNLEAKMLDDAYVFSDGYLLKHQNIIPLHEKGATNTELRWNIATKYGKPGAPLYGKELDDVIDSISDEELIDCMRRIYSELYLTLKTKDFPSLLNFIVNGNRAPMNGYMQDFMKDMESFKQRLPEVRKALKYVAKNDLPLQDDYFYAKNGGSIRRVKKYEINKKRREWFGCQGF